MAEPVRIGILGDFNPAFHSHHATNHSIRHAAARLGIRVETKWAPTPSLARANAGERLAHYHGLWASPGSPYESQDGMFAGIEFARSQGWPFVGT